MERESEQEPAEESVFVKLSTLDGLLTEIELHPPCTVSRLKSQIVDLRGVPSDWQILIVGDDVLEDKFNLNSISHDAIHVSLIVSFEEHCSRAVSSAEDKKKLLESFASISSLIKDNDHVLNFLCTCLGDNHCDVSSTVVRVLPKIVKMGDENMIRAAVSCFAHEDKNVRYNAVEALCIIARRGDAFAIDTVLGCMQSINEHVRLHAIQALGKIADCGNELCVAAVVACLEDRISPVRLAAMGCLVQIVEKGDKLAIERVAARVHSPDRDVRRAAAHVLPQIATEGNEVVIAAVIASVRDLDSKVREIALSSLIHLPDRKDPRIIQALVDQVRHDADPVARASALCVLPQIFCDSDGNEGAISAVIDCLQGEDREVPVIQAALGILPRIAGKKNNRVLQVVLNKLEHSSARIRQIALYTLHQVSAEDDECVREATRRCCEDPDKFVRTAATKLLSQLT